MKDKNLHTHTLEKLFGPISIQIKKQNESIRIVELKDKNNICRTLAIVRFFDVHGETLKQAHDIILSGELLGKTLSRFKIDFDKKYSGSLQMTLPEWLRKDFKSTSDLGMAFFSNIWVKDESFKSGKFVFAEIIEIIPEEIKSSFKYKIKPIEKINSKVLDLFKEADIDVINA